MTDIEMCYMVVLLNVAFVRICIHVRILTFFRMRTGEVKLAVWPENAARSSTEPGNLLVTASFT